MSLNCLTHLAKSCSADGKPWQSQSEHSRHLHCVKIKAEDLDELKLSFWTFQASRVHQMRDIGEALGAS